MAIALGIAGLVILVIFAAFLAAAETALVRVSRIRVKYLVEKKVDKAEKLDRLVRDPDYFLPPLLLMVLVVQLTSASLATYVTTRITGNAGIGVLVGTLVIAVFMFMFGELVPKAVASHESERVALRLTRPVAAMTWLLHPVASVFQLTARGILRLFTGESLKNELLVSDEGEIRAMVTAAEAHDIIEMEEKDMIHSVFEFSDTMVREVMVPRPDMVTLPAAATVKDALNLTIEHGFSRIPVYGSNLDEILGVLYAKDLIQYLQADELDKPVSQIVREAFIIPETKILSDLLRELRKRKVHIAMVVDEYGTMVGLVTIEDLLEEIVGEIFDEYDLEVSLVEKIDDRHFRVDARMNLEDLYEILQVDIPRPADVDSVGGLVLKVLGHLPIAGETFVYNGISVKVEKLRNNRITKVVLELLDEKTGHDPG